MEVKHYIAVSTVLSIASAIFFHFWGDRVYPGLAFMTLGFLVVYVSLTTGRFDRTVSLMTIGLLMVSVGLAIIPHTDITFPRSVVVAVSLLFAVFAGFAVMANPFDTREYGRRAKVGVIATTTFPVTALLILLSQIEGFPWERMAALGFLYFLLAIFFAMCLAPDGSDFVQGVPMRQLA